VVQLREPVSRQVSLLQMNSRIGKSHLSVQGASASSLGQWAEHTRDSPMLEALEAQMPALRGCNAADISTRKSAPCTSIAAKAGSFAALLVVKCIILPYDEANQTHVGGVDSGTIGKCVPSYPPVRQHTRPSGPAHRQPCARISRLRPVAASPPHRRIIPCRSCVLAPLHARGGSTHADRLCLPPRPTLCAADVLGHVRG
jgi:hypothetical protein